MYLLIFISTNEMAQDKDHFEFEHSAIYDAIFVDDVAWRSLSADKVFNLYSIMTSLLSSARDFVCVEFRVGAQLCCSYFQT